MCVLAFSQPETTSTTTEVCVPYSIDDLLAQQRGADGDYHKQSTPRPSTEKSMPLGYAIEPLHSLASKNNLVDAIRMD
eukprot:SAG31_NODE_1702_length_7496_cov_2.367311_10_plen_78_part_00